MYPLKGEFEKIESISNHKDLAKYLADANKAGYEEPKGMFVLADLKNPKSMRYIQGKEA
ncbi:MAG: putative metalloendopeptidase [Halioglobus sp.]|jgi:predicted metalloendopeptidase